MRKVIVSALLLAAVGSLYAEDKWVRLRTANFEVYTPQSEKKAREIALYFEQLREFFLSYWRTKADPGTPVRIILFGNEKQYEPFRPHKQAAGYFQHGIDRDWIVIGGNQQGWERIVCHEYTHLMVKQAGFNLPVWLNEGLAEVYSTFKPMGGKVQIGDLIPGHFYAVQSGWIPVSRLVEVTHSAPEYNGKDTAQFYAGSWGLTHMLMLSSENRQLYGPVITKLIEGKPVTEAFAAASVSLDRLDGDLRNYLKRNDRFYAGQIPFKSQKPDAEWTSERVAQSEVDAVLALLQVNVLGKQEDAKARLARLDPADWHSQETLAYGAWRNQDMKAAYEHFQKAMKMGATSAKMHYDAARASMYSGSRNQESVDYLKKAIALYPEWSDAKLQLLEQLNYLGRYGEAIGVSAEFKAISPRQASRLFRNMAYSQALLSALELSEASRKRAREFAKTELDKMECERLDQFLERLSAAKQSEAQRGELLAKQLREMRERADQEEGAGYGDGVRMQADELPPAIQRGRLPGEAATEAKLPVDASVVRPIAGITFIGTLRNLDCAAPHPVLRLVGEKEETLEVEMLDPKNVNLQMLMPGDKTKELELNCGEQDRRVKIIYLAPSGEGKRGELRGIEYL